MTHEEGEAQPADNTTYFNAALGMRVGVRYVVTRDSEHREFQVGDRIWLDSDGNITCSTANGWMPAEDVPEATRGMQIAPDAKWATATRADLERKLAALPQA